MNKDIINRIKTKNILKNELNRVCKKLGWDRLDITYDSTRGNVMKCFVKFLSNKRNLKPNIENREDYENMNYWKEYDWEIGEAYININTKSIDIISQGFIYNDGKLFRDGKEVYVK